MIYLTSENSTILITVLFVSSSGKLVMDYNFRPNESASFLSGVDEIKSALNSLKAVFQIATIWQGRTLNMLG